MRGASRSARTASEFLPKDRNLATMQKAVQRCQGCELYRNATQAVFGKGKKGADVMLVGEQPGDKEDLAGKPFVGPAGHLLDRCLEAAGIDRTKIYVTNAVKHFKWEPRGKLRIHKKPSTLEIAACKPWFDAEVKAVGPKLIVCLGATAAQSLLGQAFRVTRHRGEIFQLMDQPPIIATVHPSSILRAQDDESRELERQEFVEDLKRAAQYLNERSSY
jgi:uracil-DNA glycosylase